jgi:BirA family biotin operon repressor/biotin-[acetyl-CoA-carboxylase] ligase
VSERLGRLLGPDFPEPRVVLETGSTNDDLKEAAREGAPEWSVLLAGRQRAGRGREGRRWESPEGNLYLSLILRPEATWAPLISLAGGVAVAQAIATDTLLPRLKWPNDVLVGGRKVAGLLAEGLSSGGTLEAVILGIGVNLAARPEALGEAATSIRDETGASPDVIDVAAAVLGRLRFWYDSLGRDGPRPVLQAFKERSVPWWGQGVEVVCGGERVVGRLCDLDARGALILERENGSRTTLLSGEARALRPLSGS